MTAQPMSERLKLAAFGLSQSRKVAGARLKALPGLSWRHKAPRIEELLICPIDLRTPDPSFADELAAGYFGLAGETLDLKGGSPFDVPSPSREFAVALHGFDWLRHLAATRTVEAEQLARAHVDGWIGRCGHRRHGVAWQPGLTGRRLLSWLAYASLIMTSDNEVRYDRVMRSISDQLSYLSRSWNSEPVAEERAHALIALATGHLCYRGGELAARRASGWLVAELGRQLHADGGHVTRNPSVTLALLLDLLVLKQCYAERALEMPAAIADLMQRMLGFLRFLRLGDGSLASFNGSHGNVRDALATIDSLDHGDRVTLAAAPQSGYSRLACGDTVIVADTGAAPALRHSSRATASCLAFDMSAGGQILFCGAGAPAGGDASNMLRARSTAQYSTLALGETTYAQLVSGPLTASLGAPGLKGPGRVRGAITESDAGQQLEADHDGYARLYNLRHKRRLTLSADGRRVDGLDTIDAADAKAATPSGIAFAVHFHVSPDAHVRFGATAEEVEIRVHNGATWTFTSASAPISIEDGQFYGSTSSPLAVHQIVLRGVAAPGTTVAWVLSETTPGIVSEPLDRIGTPRRKLSDRLAEVIAEINAATPDDDTTA